MTKWLTHKIIIKTLVLICLLLAFLPNLSFAAEIEASYDKKELLLALIKLNDTGIPISMRLFVRI